MSPARSGSTRRAASSPTARPRAPRPSWSPAVTGSRAATARWLEARPLYRIPRTLLFASGDAAVAVGMARACLDAFFELAGVKTPRAMAGLLRDQPMVQADVGHAEADLRAGRALLTE